MTSTSPNLNNTLVGFSPLQAQCLRNSFVEAGGTNEIDTLNLGLSGTAGTLNIFPTTASKGKLVITAADSAGDTATSIVNASQSGARTYTIPDAGASASFVMTAGNQTITGTKTIPLINLGASGTAGSLSMFSGTASKGKWLFTPVDNTGDTTMTITNAAQAGAYTYTIPSAGASASFMMTQGAQTVVGANTFSANIIPTGGIAAAGGFSAAPRGLHSQGQKAIVSTDGNDTTPSTTETYITSMFVPCNMTLTGVNLFNGSNITGNVTVGLANAVDGTPIAAAKSATTAGSGTDAYQKIPFATPYAAVGPANYLVCVQYDSATARFNTHTIGTDPNLKQTSTTYGTIPTISPLPTTFTTNLSNIMSFY